MKRCAPRNIMDEILYDQKDDAAVNSQAAESQLSYLFGEQVKTEQKKRISSTPETKKKVTHYLSLETKDELDKLREQLLHLFPEIAKNTFSRSNIVEKTLKSVIKRFQHRKDRHKLLQLLLAGKKSDSVHSPSLQPPPSTCDRKGRH
ncbi:MAG: hypothetical protein P8130_14325 [Deltaproteobacteria bacterium]